MASPKKSLQEEFLDAYENLADPLFRYIFLRISDRERAKELVAETFTRVWETISRGREIEHMKAFLYRTASRLVIDEYRAKKEYSLDAMRENGFDVGFDAGIEMEAEKRLMLEELNRLDERSKETLILRFVEDVPVKEIAALFEETENVVSVRIHRGVEKLRERLTKRHEKPHE